MELPYGSASLSQNLTPDNQNFAVLIMQMIYLIISSHPVLH